MVEKLVMMYGGMAKYGNGCRMIGGQKICFG